MQRSRPHRLSSLGAPDKLVFSRERAGRFRAKPRRAPSIGSNDRGLIADEDPLKTIPIHSDNQDVALQGPIMMVRFEPQAWRGLGRGPRETIVPRPSEVERALRQMLVTYPVLQRSWRGGGVWAEVDALAEFYEGMQRMFGG